MYTLYKDIEISASHKLNLPYESKCTNLHGHNWKIRVWLRSDKLNGVGMVEDFTHIKRRIVNLFDHNNLNEVPPFNVINPTAEHIAREICDITPYCFKVEVYEQEGSYVCYEKDY